MNNPTIADTPAAIQGFRLLSLRQALKLEIVGFSLSRGGKASVTVRSILTAAGKKAPRKLSDLSDSFAAHLREIGVLVTP
jgi:hypothetical protein